MSWQTAAFVLVLVFGLWLSARMILSNWNGIRRALRYWSNR